MWHHGNCGDWMLHNYTQVATLSSSVYCPSVAVSWFLSKYYQILAFKAAKNGNCSVKCPVEAISLQVMVKGERKAASPEVYLVAWAYSNGTGPSTLEYCRGNGLGQEINMWINFYTAAEWLNLCSFLQRAGLGRHSREERLWPCSGFTEHLTGSSAELETCTSLFI